jgi:hypothetical protein
MAAKKQAQAKAVPSTPGEVSTGKREPVTDTVGKDIERTTY